MANVSWFFLYIYVSCCNFAEKFLNINYYEKIHFIYLNVSSMKFN